MFAPIKALLAFYSSSIGKKIVVALTGLGMIGFIVAHLSGNLLIFKGPDAINNYAKWLHDLGGLLWAARLGLLGMFFVHIVATVHLTAQNKLAREEAYEFQKTVQASGASRTMIITGLIVLVFIVFHIAHYTWGWFSGYTDPEGEFYLADGRHNVFKMLVHGFNFFPISAFYIVAVGLLCYHLSHGVASVFQTMGLCTKASRPIVEIGSKVFSAAIFLGYISIPIAVMFGLGSDQ